MQVFSVAKIRSKILTFPGKNNKGIILNARNVMIVLNATSKKLLAVILALLIIVLGTFFGETQASKGTTEAGKAFLTENALKEGVVSLPSGLQYRVLKSGPKGGKKPKVNTPCLCHYRGTTIEVRIYDFFAGTARVNRVFASTFRARDDRKIFVSFSQAFSLSLWDKIEARR